MAPLAVTIGRCAEYGVSGQRRERVAADAVADPDLRFGCIGLDREPGGGLRGEHRHGVLAVQLAGPASSGGQEQAADTAGGVEDQIRVRLTRGGEQLRHEIGDGCWSPVGAAGLAVVVVALGQNLQGLRPTLVDDMPQHRAKNPGVFGTIGEITGAGDVDGV